MAAGRCLRYARNIGSLSAYIYQRRLFKSLDENQAEDKK
jgi:hypothetical protein